MSDLQRTLLDLHQRLGETNRLDPDDRVMLEGALEEIRRALAVDAAQDAAQSSAPQAPPAEALEGAAVRLEAEHPGLAGAVRAVVDALGKAGI